mmetsp:Transcript_53295/g.124832  ORF Transcript_53295/g.124832 Transcript_53295/m.124832 type:complete len:98 (-) Transcript_53295:199-492(-)
MKEPPNGGKEERVPEWDGETESLRADEDVLRFMSAAMAHLSSSLDWMMPHQALHHLLTLQLLHLLGTFNCLPVPIWFSGSGSHWTLSLSWLLLQVHH